MTTSKSYPELKEVSEFIDYYNGASRMELKSALKSLGRPRYTRERNLKSALETLLL